MIFTVVAALLLGTGTQHSFSDSEFVDTNWALTLFAFGGGGFVTGVQGSGGNPGNQRSVVDSVNNGNPDSWVIGFHENVTAVYDPVTNGPILAIKYSLDFVNTSVCDIGNEGQAFGLALRQNSNVYYAQRHLTGTTTDWTNTGNLVVNANDFVLITSEGSELQQHPDFSATGAPITLGFSTANSTPSNGYCRSGAYDNWSITITSTTLSLDATPDLVAEGETLTFTTSGGTPAQLNMLVILAVNGSPFFLPLVRGPFDGNCEHVVALTTPGGLSDLETVFGSFGFDKLGALAASNVDTVAFQ